MTSRTDPRALVERPCPECGVTLNGYSGLRYCGFYTTHSHADCKADYWSSLCNDDERCHYEAIAAEIRALRKG